MPTLGQTGNQDYYSSSTANKTAVSRVTATEDGTLDSATARIWVSGGSATAKYCVYADAGDEPGAKLAESNQRTVTNTSEQAVGFTFAGASRIPIVNGTSYWIGPAWQDPGSGTLNYSRGSVSGGRREANSYAPNPFGTPNVFTGPLDTYITYLTSTPEDPDPGAVEGPVDGAFFEFFEFFNAATPTGGGSEGAYPPSYLPNY